MKVPTDKQMLVRLKATGLPASDLPSYKRGLMQVVERVRQRKAKKR